MKTRSELAYFTLRSRQSHAAALKAHEVCARDAHQGLATAYDLILSRIAGGSLSGRA